MNKPKDSEIVAIQKQEMSLLSKLAIQTFTESYYSSNEKELFERYVQDKLNPDKFLQEWLDPNSHFYFIKWKQKVCGYLKINFSEAQTESHSDEWMEIERIYVLQSFQGNQLGKALFQYALNKAKEKCIKSIWIGVWKQNQKAIGFYKHLGFEDYGTHLFDFGGVMQEDALMKFNIVYVRSNKHWRKP